MEGIEIKILDLSQSDQIIDLILQLNPDGERPTMNQRLIKIFSLDHYKCFGVFSKGQLVGLSGLWILTKFYSGKQAEIDNFVIDGSQRSKGYGELLINHIEQYAKSIDCKSVELNAYIINERSHGFYETKKYKKLGYHFVKLLK